MFDDPAPEEDLEPRQFNAAGPWGIRVLRDRCATCIFRPGNPMLLEPGRVHDLVQQAQAHDTAIICHSTLDLPEQAVCRGFADAYDTTPLHVARRLGKLVEVPAPSPHPTSLQGRADLTSPPCVSARPWAAKDPTSRLGPTARRVNLAMPTSQPADHGRSRRPVGVSAGPGRRPPRSQGCIHLRTGTPWSACCPTLDVDLDVVWRYQHHLHPRGRGLTRRAKHEDPNR